jgi:hypothetical protein
MRGILGKQNSLSKGIKMRKYRFLETRRCTSDDAGRNEELAEGGQRISKWGSKKDKKRPEKVA